MLLKIEQTPTFSQPVDGPTNQKEAPHTPLEKSRQLKSDVDDSVQALLEDPELQMLYHEAQQVRDQVNLVQCSEKNIRKLRNMITEYLGSFILLGYDLKGQRTIVQHTPQQTDTDSIQKYLEHITSSGIVFANGLNSRQGNSPTNGGDD